MDHGNIEDRWQSASAATVAIKQLRSLKGFLQAQGVDPAPAFILGDRVLRCMDGRTPGGVHLAGSGILLGKTLEGSLEKTAAVVRPMDVDAVTYHPDCGAAAAFAQTHPELGMTGDGVARKFVERLGEKLAVPVREQLLVGEAGFHHESAIYYAGVDFDPSRVEELPVGFVINRGYLDPKYALKEVKIAIGIALGDHGFGKRFDRDHPLLVVAVGERDGDLSVEKLDDELRDLVVHYNGRAILDRLVKL